MVQQSLYQLLEQERIQHEIIREDLEKKNRELLLINEQLKEANKNLEGLVKQRTEEIKSIGLWLYKDITEGKQLNDIIALAANAVKSEREESLQNDMNNVLAKRFEGSELVQLIAKWMGDEGILKNTVKKNIEEDKPLYDLSKLREVSNGNKQFIQKMIQLFRKESMAAVEKIKEAYANGDIEKIKAAAHKIKPSFQTMSIDCVAEDIRQLESFDIAKNNKEVLRSLINKLDAVINKVVLQLEGNVLV
jgi:HPt (histidine-containing phosphotransfer) domain-containing protein/CheY-like chemotaxis protein